MEIKPAADKQPEIDLLTALLGRPDVDEPTRRRIDQEIRNITVPCSLARRASSVYSGSRFQMRTG